MVWSTPVTHPEEMQRGQEDPGNIQRHIAVTQNQRRLAAQVGLQLQGEKDLSVSKSTRPP